MSLRSRLAPTPSGFLHVGNAVNFLRTWLLVRAAGGTLRLRIDDADSERSRPEFVADIFEQLDWLGLSWDEGPIGPDDFTRHHSQLQRLDRYRQCLLTLANSAHLFACACSRREILAHSQSGLYPGTCRGRRVLADGQPVRIHVPIETKVAVSDSHIPLCREMGDFVLWRRGGLPAYQLASLVDDLDHRITLIVRGRDLLDSSAAQLFLAQQLGQDDFCQTTFIHHPLITCAAGKKLSKSHGSLSLKAMREGGASVVEIYRLTARQLGIEPNEIVDLSDLMAAHRERLGASGGESYRQGETS